MPAKKKLSTLLVEKGYCQTEKKAISLVLSGSVLVNEQKITKAGFPVVADAQIRLLEKIPHRVSRAGQKLKYAIRQLAISVEGKICLDLGASTGGFTEVLLEEQAQKVYAFDVGYGQMVSRLARDRRVLVRDRFNVKKITCEDLEEIPAELFISTDLSFTPLIPIYESLVRLRATMPDTIFWILSLIKPQFECRQQELHRGIVKDSRVHYQVLKKIGRYIRGKGIFRGFCHSPVHGTTGNREFFVYWSL